MLYPFGNYFSDGRRLQSQSPGNLQMVSSYGNPIATRPLPQSEIKANNKTLLLKGKWWLRAPLKDTLFTVGVAFTALVGIPMFKGGKNFWPLDLPGVSEISSRYGTVVFLKYMELVKQALLVVKWQCFRFHPKSSSITNRVPSRPCFQTWAWLVTFFTPPWQFLHSGDLRSAFRWD